jgi:thiol-disulfide isomerase/thioredoxin
MIILRSILASMLLVSACSQPDSIGRQSSQLHTDDYTGKWLVINYWAEWCLPCRREIPELNRFAEKYRNSIAVFAVNFDGALGTELDRQIKKFDIQFNILESDPANQLAYPSPVVLPTTIFIDPEGKIHHTLIGPQTLATLEAQIQRPL